MYILGWKDSVAKNRQKKKISCKIHVWAGKIFQPERMEISLWKITRHKTIREDKAIEQNLQDELWTSGMNCDQSSNTAWKAE